MGSVHDLEDLTLDSLEGYEIRVNEPGGAHYEGRIERGVARVWDIDGKLPPIGEYELSFRAPGTTAWHNDARISTVTVA